MMWRSLALRLARLEASTPERAWLHSDGLSALLTQARHGPVPEGDLEEAPDTAMRRLVAEARQWRAEHPHP